MPRSLLTPLMAVALLLCVTCALDAQATGSDQFGAPKADAFAQAKTQSLAWLKAAKADAVTLKQANDLWDEKADQPILDRVAETLLLGSAEGRELIAAARDPHRPAPLNVPALFVNDKESNFFRANLGLYFAKHMAARRVYEECLATLRAFDADDTVDPASYHFFRAVAANKLRFKDEAVASVKKLLANSAEAPERYVVVAVLMQLEMAQWKDNDLGDIARRMKEVEDRLENARHGQATIDAEEEIVRRLAKLIEDLERQNNPPPGPPGPGKPGPGQPDKPAERSQPGDGPGDGKDGIKDLIKKFERWGNLPEKERIQAFEAIKREYPPHIAEAIRGYLIKGGKMPESPK